MRRALALGVAFALAASACAVSTARAPRGDAGRPPSPGDAGAPTGRPVDAAQAERLRRLMVPLIQAMDHPRPLDQVRVGVVDDARINAASAGGGEFYVTTGLLARADDRRLQAVLAHEVAHDDLGHAARAQALGLGLRLGMILLDRVVPGSGAVTPIAGTLIARRYSRSEEYAADRHGVALLRRVGGSKEQMIDALTWLLGEAGERGGGFFATHPATGDRIEALRRVP